VRLAVRNLVSDILINEYDKKTTSREWNSYATLFTIQYKIHADCGIYST